MRDISQVPWAKDSATLMQELATTEHGLPTTEARARLDTYGKNIIGARTHAYLFSILKQNICNPLVGILLVACLLSLFLHQFTETTFIAVIIVINILLGFFQEYKAHNALSKLETYITHKTRVKRDDTITYIPSDDLVPGDIVVLKQGNRVPADIRIIEMQDVETDESLLTGESLPVTKHTDNLPSKTLLGDRHNMLWAGTTVVQGEATGVVVRTGMHTEIGNIASLIRTYTDLKTPLEQAVARLARLISIALIILGLCIFFIGLSVGFPLGEISLLSIAVIVSAIPESLPITMSVVLALSAIALARKQSIVKKLSATETLGSTTLILTDKTGTLTEGSLTLLEIDALYGAKNDILLEAGLNIDIAENKETGELSGRPVEKAIAHALRDKSELQPVLRDIRVIDTLHFDSMYKFSAVMFLYGEERIVSLLGAPDILLSKTDSHPQIAKQITSSVERYATNGERVLGVVSQTVPEHISLKETLKGNAFRYHGLMRFRDPVRATVPSAVRDIASAGVRTVMVTGDHPSTATAIARDIELPQKDTRVITGEDMDRMTDTELLHILARTTIFARVTPEHKLRLVELYTRQGEVVAVTGDGVNDAPALKHAAIGVAMGSGTDVAHASSDLIILNNNFETIVEAIFEGRNVLRKMRSVITYLLADCFDELMLIGGSIVLTLPLPLSALQILFVKFFADIFPAMAFSFERTDAFGRIYAPQTPNLFDSQVRLFTIWRGLISSLILLTIYIFLLHKGFDEALVRTFTFASFSSYILFLAFSMRNLDRSLFSYNPLSNKWLTGGVLLGLVTTGLAIYLPFLQHILGTVPLPLPWIYGVAAIGITNLAIMELCKKWYTKN